MKSLINRQLLKSFQWEGLLRYGYGFLLLFPPGFHLLDKVSNDAGGPLSRYLPLSIALVLVVGHSRYIKRKPLKRRLLWRIFLYIYWFAISLLIMFILYLFFINGVSIIHPALTGLVWAVLTMPAAFSIARYINQNFK